MVREVWINDKKIIEVQCSVGISFEGAVKSTKELKERLIREGKTPANIKYRVVSKTKGNSDWI